MNRKLTLAFPTEEEAEIYKMIKRNINLIVFNELEKVRRYFNFRFERLLDMGLEAKVSSDINIEGNKIKLEVTIEIPEAFYQESAIYIYKKYFRSPARRNLWEEEMEADKVLEEQTRKEEDKQDRETDVDLEVEFIERDTDTST